MAHPFNSSTQEFEAILVYTVPEKLGLHKETLPCKTPPLTNASLKKMPPTQENTHTHTYTHTKSDPYILVCFTCNLILKSKEYSVKGAKIFFLTN